MGTRGKRRLAGLLLIAAAFAAGCGEDDFKNNPRPPVPLELTGVIKNDEVTVSPSELGAGPVLLTISNQSRRARTVTLEGESLTAEVGPIEPLETATIRRTLEPGSYEVRAGSETAMRRATAPAQLEIGAARPNSNDALLLP